MKSVKWTAILGSVLCGLCCLLPVIGFTVGIGALGSFVGHVEKLGFALLILSAVLFLWHTVRKSTGCKNCATSCGCQGNTHSTRA